MAKKVKPKKKQLFCDPAVCLNCVYICEGDFLCDKDADPVVVMSDWMPTVEYLRCVKRRNKNG